MSRSNPVRECHNCLHKNTAGDAKPCIHCIPSGRASAWEPVTPASSELEPRKAARPRILSPYHQRIKESIEARRGEYQADVMDFYSEEEKPESILQEAQRLTEGDRQDAYGHPLEAYTMLANVWSAFLGTKLKEPLTAEDTVVMMTAMKLCREITNPKRDNRVDTAGYANVSDMIAIRREELDGT